jgi:hypothetical protein
MAPRSYPLPRCRFWPATLLLAALLVALAGLLVLPAAQAYAVTVPRGLAEDSPFIDVYPDDPDFDAIYALWNAGIIAGYEVDDGVYEFRPYNPVLRQHFAKMIVLTLGVPTSEDDVCPFEDVDVSGPYDFYPDNYIAAAYFADITNGTSFYTFSPWDDVTRAQLMTMVVRALENYAELALEDPDWTYEGFMAGFDDPTHGYNAQLAEWNGLLVGIDLYGWDVWEPATRGEVAQVLWNAVGLLPGD